MCRRKAQRHHDGDRGCQHFCHDIAAGHSGATISVNPALRDPSTGQVLSSTADHHGAAVGDCEASARTRKPHRSAMKTASSRPPCLSTWPKAARSATGRPPSNRRKPKFGLPNNVRGSFAGSARDAQQSQNQQPLLILAALVVIYIVLGILYESLIHPITVLSTLPSAGVGAVLALLLFKMDFSIIALIGVFLLIGIVKKNAILIIDFAMEAERSRGLSAVDAVREACLLRFRPILMTTLAAILGALPLAIGFGEGAELRRPLGVSIIGGLIASQLLTLLTTPVVYVLLDKLRRRGPSQSGSSGRHPGDDSGQPPAGSEPAHA